jgi:hypothetical protein
VGENISEQKTEFVPSFHKYPEFHYGNKNFYESRPVESAETNARAPTNMNTQRSPSRPATKSEIITVRVRSNTDEDFIEFDLDKLTTDFEAFKNLCRKELDHIDVRRTIFKMRKLPNILIRNTDDVRRLKNEQEIEIIFV